MKPFSWSAIITLFWHFEIAERLVDTVKCMQWTEKTDNLADRGTQLKTEIMVNYSIIGNILEDVMPLNVWKMTPSTCLWTVGGKPEYLKETHKCSKRPCKLHRKTSLVDLGFGTFLLRGDIASHPYNKPVFLKKDLRQFEIMNVIDLPCVLNSKIH